MFLVICLCFSNQNAQAQAEKRPNKKPDLSPKKRLLRKYGKTKTDKYKGEIQVTKGKTDKSGKAITVQTRKQAKKTGISGLITRVTQPKKHKGVSGLITRIEQPKKHKGVSGFVIRVSPNKITKREGSYKGVPMSLVNRHKKAINNQRKKIAQYKGMFTYVDKRATLYARKGKQASTYKGTVRYVDKRATLYAQKGKQASTYKGFIRVRKRPYMATTHTYQKKNYSKPYDIRNLKKGLWLPKKGDMPRYMRQKVARPKADKSERQIWDTYAPNTTKRNTKLTKATNASGTNSTGMPQRTNPKDLNKKDKNPLPR